MRAKARIVLIGIMLCLASSGQARTWIVERDGSGDFTAIQPAVDAAASGDTIMIGPGEYTDFQSFIPPGFGELIDVFIYVETDNLTLIGNGSNMTVVRPPIPGIHGDGPQGILFGPSISIASIQYIQFSEMRFGVFAPNGRLAMLGCQLDSCDVGVLFLGEILNIDDCSFQQCLSDGLLLVGALGASVRNSNFADCLYGINANSTQDIYVANSDISEGDIGVQYSSSSGSIINCHLSNQNNVGINLRNYSNVTAIGNTVENSRIGLAVINYNTISADSNAFHGGSEATIWIAFSPISLHGNHILNAGGHSVLLGEHNGSPPPIIDLTGNYWGTTDSEQIAEWIWDGNDQPSLNAFVEYEPFASGPIGTEPATMGRVKAMYR